MRPWYYYILTDSLDEPANQSITTRFEEDEKDIDNQREAVAYESKKSFFDTYFCGRRRQQNYDNFIYQNIVTDQSILSVGSGRCANELMLIDRGHQVMCSDLSLPESIQATKELFPQFEQVSLDILSGPSKEKYDVVLCLSVIYLFNDQDLRRFFDNVYASLKTGGHLILDSAGATDSLLSYWITDIYLRYEVKLYRWFRSLKYRKRHMIITKQLGYRRTDEEIVGAAASCGFQLVSQKNYDFLTEFERTIVIRRLLGILPPLAGIFARLGKNIPYTRMYNLGKV